MIKSDYILKIIYKLKKEIRKCIYGEVYNDALMLISMCAKVLYETNLYYFDDELENSLKRISIKLGLSNREKKSNFYFNRDVIVFFDGFGLNDRGLVQIYLEALCKVRKVVYITYEDKKESLPDVLGIISKYNCEKRFINRTDKSIIEQIFQLNGIIEEMRPTKFFLYSVPDDVLATSVMFAYENKIRRYHINLTDHAFWLGAKCLDICIEFRKYGASISKQYRNINEDKIVIIPFYPILHEEREFQGFPFKKINGQKIVFSGGSLYKTLGENNKYYKMVEHVLKEHKNVVFWYAGSGNDSKIKKIIAKYPKRVFLTQERSDLYQVLKKCDIFLNTYPMCGGLMFQYAALAGCVPITLKSGNISDDFLIDQKSLNVEFDNLSSLYSEINKLLVDEVYSNQRSMMIKKSVTSKENFEDAIKSLLDEKQIGDFSINFENINTNDFRDWYLSRLSKSDIDAILNYKIALRLHVIHYPIYLFGRVFAHIKRDFSNCLFMKKLALFI